MVFNLVLWAFIGGVMGWLLFWAADVIPARSATRHTVHHSDQRTPAWAQFMAAIRSKNTAVHDSTCFRLRLAVEALSALGLAYLWWTHGYSDMFFSAALVFSYLLLIMVIDLKYRLIPNRLTYPGIVLLVTLHLATGSETTLHYFVGGGMAFAIFFLTAWISPGNLGGGDVKLATLIGLAYGFPNMLLVFLVGTLAGGVAVVYLLIAQKRTLSSSMPYAPFLCLGALVGFLFNPFFLFG